jgi:diamine N-acetyltransferase
MFSIRLAQADDLPALARIAGKTFMETYTEEAERDNNLAYVKAMLNETKWREAWENPHQTIFLLFEQASLVGFANLDSETLPTQLAGKRALQLKRIYLSQAVHGKGAGKLLMAHCKAFAWQKGFESLWLIVWERNEKALRFYEKQGFRHIGLMPFKVLEKEYEDWLMYCPLFFEN